MKNYETSPYLRKLTQNVGTGKCPRSNGRFNNFRNDETIVSVCPVAHSTDPRCVESVEAEGEAPAPTVRREPHYWERKE